MNSKLSNIENELRGHLIGRDEQVRLALIALVSGHHYAVIGRPGTAKSMMFRAVASHFSDARYFERVLDKYTPKDEIFGPVSVTGLKNDDLRRNVEGRLPTAHLAFLDEAFKASSALLNSLLALLNERVFENGSAGIVKSPLRTVFAAANEYPGDDGGDALNALWDRFLIRGEVEYLSDGEARTMLDMDGEYQPVTTMSVDELDAARAAVSNVAVKGEVKDSLIALRAMLRDEHGVQVSDRRLRQSLGLLRANAFIEGRSEVGTEDFMVLLHALWEDRDERGAVGSVIMKAVDPYLIEVNRIMEDVAEYAVTLKGDDLTAKAEAMSKMQASERRLNELEKLVTTDIARRRIDTVRDNVRRAVADYHAQVVGLDVDAISRLR